MHIDDGSKVSEIHFAEGLVAQDARVVHEYVHAPPFVDSAGHHCLNLAVVRNVGAVRHRLATLGFNLRNDFPGGIAALADAIETPAEIVHDHARAAAREFECVTFAETVTGTGNDHHLIVKSYAQC